jgi:hypothetical protein
MGSIEDRIIGLQTKNFESAYFVPAEDIEELLTESTVRDLVKQCGIEVQHQEETISIIISGARKIFAILILIHNEVLIRKFVEHDQFQIEKLDAKLPLSEPGLASIIGNSPAKNFFQKQWMFVSPYFRNDLSHRTLDPDVVLPFILSSSIGRGAFGSVSEVVLHPHHQGILGATDIKTVGNPVAPVEPKNCITSNIQSRK